MGAGISVSDDVVDAVYGPVRGFYEQAAPRFGLPTRRDLRGADGELLLWGARKAPSGWLVVVASRTGVVAVRLGHDLVALLDELRGELHHSLLREEPEAVGGVLDALGLLAEGSAAADMPVDARGTAFQTEVWEALRSIPRGQTRTYSDIANQLGRPTSVRAVARACATNPAALVVPCHRVIRSDGTMGGYRWGLDLKVRLLEREADPAD